MIQEPSVIASVIDIGSNSIRYLCAAVTPQGVTAVEPKRLVTTRLAQGLEQSGLLDEDAIRRSLEAIREFEQLSRAMRARALFAYATSAVRDAKNGADFCARVLRETGVKADVLPGAEEARLAYLGAAGLAGGGLIDIGGGSAQVLTQACRLSFPIGCIRVKDSFPAHSFVALHRALVPWLDARCAGLDCIRQPRWTGVGGTITTLGALHAGLTRYDPAIVSRQSLSLESVEKLLDELERMGDARRAHPLLKDRHDSILCGGGVLLELMRRMQISDIAVSDCDGMEGYLLGKSYLLLKV